MKNEQETPSSMEPAAARPIWLMFTEKEQASTPPDVRTLCVK
jgi:hypothetical protein